MARTATLFLFLGFFVVSLAYGAAVTLFEASFDGTNVRVEWAAGSEAGVQSYDIWRKANNEPSFARLTTVAPSSQQRYSYLDNNVYRGVAGTSGGAFTYRLTVHSATGAQSYTTVLSTMPSAMQRSWGSIKSMFR